MPNPTDRATDREQRQRGAIGQTQRARDGHERVVDGRRLTKHSLCRVRQFPGESAGLRFSIGMATLHGGIAFLLASEL